MPKNFVDTLLARADNSYAPIMISVFMVLEEHFAHEKAQSALDQITATVPAMQYRFDGSWRKTTPASRKLITGPWPPRREGQRELMNRLLRSELDLAREVPLRVGLFENETHSMVSMQLHHAAGDGRSIMYLIAWFFAMLGEKETRLPLREHATNGLLVSAGLRSPRSIGSLFSSRSAVLAPRAARLRGHSTSIGQTVGASLRFKQSGGGPVPRAELVFIAALFAACASNAVSREHPIRFRMPVDLRPELGLKEGVENFCSALSLEISADEIDGLRDAPQALMDLIAERRESLLRSKAHLAFLPKGWMLSKFASTHRLRNSMRSDLMQHPRANTLVLTWMGNVAKCARPFYSRVRDVSAHTPTWGAIGFTIRDEFLINLNYFDGIWDADYLANFKENIASWLREHFDLREISGQEHADH